ncbi:MAG: methionine--tRNA ligase [Alphaproteobacteria bacterium]
MARVLITSALPYINGIKHLGNLIGSMLPADVYARFLRQRGDEVLYICATDEHGTPAELAAQEAGLEVAEYCRIQYRAQADIGQRFGLSFDHFGRSSSPQNAEITQHLCAKLDENGYIDERTSEQVYAIDDGRFLPDRYIVGTCPHCKYEQARGDQCENCTRLLDPQDLLDARSANTGSTNLEVRETRHLFLRLDTLQDRVAAWIDRHPDWPLLVSSIAKKWLKEGLHERSITRDLSWGIPVDRPGFEGKVFYVWFDAPIAYIAATKEWADLDPQNRDWKSWWWEADDVRYVEFMAKDNVPFHTINFPATLIGSGEPWKLVDYVKGFNWLTFYGGKFSTSQRRGIFMDKALDEFPADYWRYWLIANAPESNDSSFTFSSFSQMVNADLADNLGNFVSRCLKLTQSKFSAAVPEGGAPGAAEQELAAALDTRIAAYTDHMSAMQYRRSIDELRAIWTLGNNYIAHNQPWTVVKTDPDRAACILRTCINLVRLYAVLAWPIIPETASRLLGCLGLDEPQPDWPKLPAAEELTTLAPGHAFEVPPPLFQKITEERLAELTERYGGEE